MKKMLQAEIVLPLLAWFEQNRRDLPWRKDREPYHVWISEIMLQQTRIEAVMDYYARFLTALPTVKDLAQVPEEQLLKLWEGLGYYNRARNLKKAAGMIMDRYCGSFPHTFEELKKLPGIGDYTAGAIASLCFNEPVTAVDGNVLRVLSRLTGDRTNVLLPEAKKQAEQKLSTILPPESGKFNEALMELGETVCLPNGEPLCSSCPLADYCTAYRKNLTAELPVRIKDTTRRLEVKTVLIFRTSDDSIALSQREKTGLLAGLYELPNREGILDEKEIRSLSRSLKLKVRSVEFHPVVKHLFTHIEWQMHPVIVRVTNRNNLYFWASPAQLKETYALPTAFLKCLKE